MQYGASGMEQQLPYSYGTSPMKPRTFASRSSAFNINGMMLGLFVPWFLFNFVSGLLSFSIHYDSPRICQAFVMVSFLFVLSLGYSAWRRRAMGVGDSNWYVFLFVTSLIAFLAASWVGVNNFAHNMRPYYDVMSMNNYPSVNPANYKGQQLMDMGRVTFSTDTRLDLLHSMGFRNLDVYCVAPIVSGNGSMPQYDFWAVGINCCSGHTSDFSCGEFNNPLAHSGLRLMRDDLRPYFRLAVQQAEAAYGIKTQHPIFLYYMQDPVAEINAYQDDGYQEYVVGIVAALLIQIILVIFAGISFSRLGPM